MQYKGSEHLPEIELSLICRDLVQNALATHALFGAKLMNTFRATGPSKDDVENCPPSFARVLGDTSSSVTARLHTPILDEHIPANLLTEETFTYLDNFTGHTISALQDTLGSTVSASSAFLIQPSIDHAEAARQFFIRRQDLYGELIQSGYVEFFRPIHQLGAYGLALYATPSGECQLGLSGITEYVRGASIEKEADTRLPI